MIWDWLDNQPLIGGGLLVWYYEDPGEDEPLVLKSAIIWSCSGLMT